MPSPRRRALRRLAAPTTVLAVGVALAIPGAASAAPDTIRNDGMTWWNVADDALGIASASAAYVDLFGTGIDVAGWTDSAFSAALFEKIAAANGVSHATLAMTPTAKTVVQNGLSTVTASGAGTFPIGGTTIAADVALEVQGSYARWTVEAWSDDPLPYAAAVGMVGSGFGTHANYSVISNRVMVNHDGTVGTHPIIGFQVTGAGAVSGNADGAIDFVLDVGDVPEATRLTIALQDYDPCGKDAALADMIGRVSALDAGFGQTIRALDTSCFTVTQPAAFAPGTSTDQLLPLTNFDPALSAWYGGGLANYFDDPSTLLLTEGMPAGLSLTVDAASRTLRLSGQAAEGVYPVRLAFLHTSMGEYYEPLFATLEVRVARGAGGGELAQSGASDAVPWFAGGAALLLLSGTGALVARRRSAAR